MSKLKVSTNTQVQVSLFKLLETSFLICWQAEPIHRIGPQMEKRNRLTVSYNHYSSGFFPNRFRKGVVPYIYMCVIRNLDLWLFSSVVSCNLTPQKNKFTRMGNTCYVICEYIQEFDKWQNPLQVNTQMSVAFHPKKSIQCSLF